MQLNTEHIITILKLFEESNFNTIHLECGDLKLVVAKEGGSLDQGVPEQPNQSTAVAAASTGIMPDAKGRAIDQPPKQTGGSEPNAAMDVNTDNGLVAIKAPMVGVFYSRPEPGAEPFVSVGSEVDEKTTVGIFEVMKVFSTIASGIKGIITKILVEDAQFVEYGQPLFLVRPEGEPEK